MTRAACPENHTGAIEFLLLGFQLLPSLKAVLFLIFLSIYILTVAGNVLVTITVISYARLQSPMYIFLCNLSCLEICYTSSVLPTLLGGLLTNGLSISLPGCLMQFFSFCWLATSECFLITAMAYDRYVAICHPLHYRTLMGLRVCFRLTVGIWASGLSGALITIFLLCQLQFPDHNEMDAFFCDLTPLMKAACSDPSMVEMEAFVFCFLVVSLQFLLIVTSYVYIISAILKIPSSSGRHKAFSTCSAHLAVGITYFGMLTIMYMLPARGHTLNLNKAFSLLYTVGTPMLNPIVYTLRNREIRGAMENVFSQTLESLTNIRAMALIGVYCKD
ncbi:olfactory receptor 11A1-like [Ambystoma mexicanum]|uniref:olfactory receptor 11A1-like n=1 Tax=Ambystoma mexicanum TaxID=8296 RepID=UPI0037E83AA8